MNEKRTWRIAVIPGDGIGTEVVRDVGVPEHDLEDIARDFGDQRDDALAILNTSI